jgi:hypothetical protein
MGPPRSIWRFFYLYSRTWILTQRLSGSQPLVGDGDQSKLGTTGPIILLLVLPLVTPNKVEK